MHLVLSNFLLMMSWLDFLSKLSPALYIEWLLLNCITTVPKLWTHWQWIRMQASFSAVVLSRFIKSIKESISTGTSIHSSQKPHAIILTDAGKPVTLNTKEHISIWFQGYKVFPCSYQLSMKFVLKLNIKMQTKSFLLHLLASPISFSALINRKRLELLVFQYLIVGQSLISVEISLKSFFNLETSLWYNCCLNMFDVLLYINKYLAACNMQHVLSLQKNGIFNTEFDYNWCTISVTD